MDFDFYDNRTTSTKVLNSLGYTDGEHEVYARHRASNFHIGFFLFYRDRETYTIVEYYQENRVQKKLERTLLFNSLTCNIIHGQFCFMVYR